MSNKSPNKKVSCPCKKLPRRLSSLTAAEYGDIHSLSKRFSQSNGKDKSNAISFPLGYNPLHISSQNGHAAATLFLLNVGFNVNGDDECFCKEGSDIIQKNVRVSAKEIGDLSENKRYDGNSCSNSTFAGKPGCTPLHRASFSGAVCTMEILIQWNRHGLGMTTVAEKNHQNGEGSINNNFKPKIETRENKYCNLLARDRSFGDYMTPLHKAAAGGRYLAVKLLLDKLEVICDSFYNAHQMEIKNRNIKSNEKLQYKTQNANLLHRALEMKDFRGRTALEVAKELECNQEVERLSVRRWDSVAGGVADWSKCAILLENACTRIEIGGGNKIIKPNEKEQNTNIVSDVIDKISSIDEKKDSEQLKNRGKSQEYPPLPNQLNSIGDACFECEENDMINGEKKHCSISSWQSAFHSVLSSSIGSILLDGQAKESNTNVNNELEKKKNCEVSTSTIRPFRDEVYQGRHKGSEVTLGKTCDLCNLRCITLFRSNHHGNLQLICQKCHSFS